MISNFIFVKSNIDTDTYVSPGTLYTDKRGYGFFTEKVSKPDTAFAIPELNSGFTIWPWFQGKTITKISEAKEGLYTESDEETLIPLSFKCKVEAAGNYLVTVTMQTGQATGEQLFLFTNGRRLMEKADKLRGNCTFSCSFPVNVCDTIPSGQTEAQEDRTIDVTMIGRHIFLNKISIKPITVPTIFIAGDSTAADQPGNFPYDPMNCYCGWGQVLSYYLNSRIAVSNHAHSGLTTESFRTDGHFELMKQYIRPNDFVFFQFGHNDQKLHHLRADTGYYTNMKEYMKEIREICAIPVIVSPLCRNSWKGNNGAYNDLLSEYARECEKLSVEQHVLLLDLHKLSRDFIMVHGLEDTKRYFYPGDFSHLNDYGAYTMAEFIANEMTRFRLLKGFVQTRNDNFIPPSTVVKATPPKGVKYNPTQTVPVEFTDIANSLRYKQIHDLAENGMLSQREKEFRPKDKITRVEALEILCKMANFFPTNLYKDWFRDVIGHEWYAGIVECSYSNGLIDEDLIEHQDFKPNEPVTYDDLLHFCINTYKSRKRLPVPKAPSISEEEYVLNVADEMGIFDSTINLSHQMTREETATVLYQLYRLLTK